MLVSIQGFQNESWIWLKASEIQMHNMDNLTDFGLVGYQDASLVDNLTDLGFVE